MRILFLATAAFLLLGAHQAAAQAYPPDGKLGAKYGPWNIRYDDGYNIGRNIIDADNWSWYTFWVEPFVVKIIAPSGVKIASGTLQVQFGSTKTLTCLGQYCIIDRDEFDDDLQSAEYAIVDLKLGDGKKAGPFNMPLEGLLATLFMCGDSYAKSPRTAKTPRYLNPEPEVNPQPRR